MSEKKNSSDFSIESDFDETCSLDIQLHRLSLQFKNIRLQRIYDGEQHLCSFFFQLSSFVIFVMHISLLAVAYFHFNYFKNIKLVSTLSKNVLFIAVCTDFVFLVLSFCKVKLIMRSILCRFYYCFVVAISSLACFGYFPFFTPDSLIGIYTSGSLPLLLPLVLGVNLNIPIVDIFILHVLYQLSVFQQLYLHANSPIFEKLFCIVFGFFQTTVGLLAAYFLLFHKRQCFVQKITLKHKTNNRLKELGRLHEDSLKQKGKYIAQVAHDIGTPLQTFSLSVELLQTFATNSDIEQILVAAECAIELMTVTRREALDHAKHMSGIDLVPSLRPADLRMVMSKCAVIMEGFGSNEAKPLSFFVDPDLPKSIITDCDWIWLMITNLLSNAKKYSSRGHIQTVVQQRKGQEAVRIEVLDDGIGVPDNLKQKLFKPFGQIMKGAGGTGLGLNGVLLKAKRLGGRVGIRDNPLSMTGTIFWFEVPYKCTLEDANLGLGNQFEAKTAKSSFLKKNGAPLRRVLVLGCDKTDLLKDSIVYMREKNIEVEVYKDPEDFFRSLKSKSDNSLETQDDRSHADSIEVTLRSTGCPLKKKIEKSRRVSVEPALLNLDYSKQELEAPSSPNSTKHEPERSTSEMRLIPEESPKPRDKAKANPVGFFIEAFTKPGENPASPLPASGKKFKRQTKETQGFDAIFWWASIKQLCPRGTMGISCAVQKVMEVASGKAGTKPYMCVIISESVPSPKTEAQPQRSPHMVSRPSSENSMSRIRPFRSRSDVSEKSCSSRVSEHPVSPQFLVASQKSPSSLRDSPPASSKGKKGKIFFPRYSEESAKIQIRKGIAKRSLPSIDSNKTKRRSTTSHSKTRTWLGYFSRLNKRPWKQKRRPRVNLVSHYSRNAQPGSPHMNAVCLPFLEEDDEAVEIMYSRQSAFALQSQIFTSDSESQAIEDSLKKIGVDLILHRQPQGMDLANILLMKVVKTETNKPTMCTPLAIANSRSPGVILNLAPTSLRSSNRGTVLLVDDDVTNLKFTSIMLKNAGYQVMTERNGFEGFNRLVGECFKIALIDRNMPVMDGTECVRRFRRWELKALRSKTREHKQRILMFSASSDQCTIDESLKAGADMFLGMPAKFEEICKCIEEPHPQLFEQHVGDERLQPSSIKKRTSENEEAACFPTHEARHSLFPAGGKHTKVTSFSMRERACPQTAHTSPAHTSPAILRRKSRFASDVAIESTKDKPENHLQSARSTSTKKSQHLDEFLYSYSSHSDDGKHSFREAVQRPTVALSITMDSSRSSRFKAALSSHKTLSESLSETNSRGRILVVDDDATIRKLTQKMLVNNGFEVDVAENGYSGLAALKKKAYQIAIIDMNMPIMDGSECVIRFRKWEQEKLQLKEREHKQVIFVCTGGTPSPILVDQNCVELFLEKPLKIRRLLEEIQNYSDQNNSSNCPRLAL